MVFFAVYFPYLVIFIAGVFLLMHHEVLKMKNPFQVFLQKKKEVLSSFIVGVVAWISAYLLKFFIQIPRPFDVFKEVTPLIPEHGFAFPSGHATFYMALAMSIFFFHKKAGYVFIFFAVLIGLARVIAGVHYPVDILAGFVLGALVAYFAKNIYPHT